MHHSQVVFGGGRSRQLLYGTNSSPHHLAKRAKNPKESLCSKAEENQAREELQPDVEEKLIVQPAVQHRHHLIGAHQKVPYKASFC